MIFPVNSELNSKILFEIIFSNSLKSNCSVLEILSLILFNLAIAASEPSFISEYASCFPFSKAFFFSSSKIFKCSSC